MNGLKRLLRAVLFVALVVLIVAVGCASTEDAQSPSDANQTTAPLTEETTTAPPSTATADVADEADEATEVEDEAPGGTAVPLWAFLTDIDPEGMELWSEMVCELRTNWGSDVESYETNLLTLTRDSNPNFQVIRDYTPRDVDVLGLADDVIQVKCPEVLSG